eukprot:gene20160-28534_t
MSEFESIPELVRILSCSNIYYDKITKSQLESLQRQHINVLIPMSYLGRYLESYQVALNQRMQAIESVQISYKNEENARKHVDFLLNNNNNNMNNNNNYNKDELNVNITNAKLQLADAEDKHEEAKLVESDIANTIKDDSIRLMVVEKKQLL